MKKKYFYWGLVIVVVFLLAIPKISWENSDAQASQNSKTNVVEADVLVMNEKAMADHLYLNASLMGDEEIDLRTEIAGKVIKINFDEGSRVKKGDLLVKINDADLQAQLDKVKSQIKLAEEKEYRSKTLLEQNLISQEEYDVILNELNSRKADEALLTAQIEKTEIHAPFDGIVGLRSISEGSFINSSISIAILTKTDPIKIDFALPIKHANKVKIGNKVKVTVPNSDKEFTAQIYAIDPKVDPTTRTLKIRARAENNSGILLPGSYAEVEVILNENSNSISVPTEAIVPDIDGEMVYLYEKGKAVPSRVTTGIRTNTEVQIVEGVTVGDTVITSALIQLRPGADVSIRNFR